MGSFANLRVLDDESFKYGVPFSRHDDAFDGQTELSFLPSKYSMQPPLVSKHPSRYQSLNSVLAGIEGETEWAHRVLRIS